jgi:hypothetical protein
MSTRMDVLRVTTLALMVFALALRRAERRVVDRLATGGASGPSSAVGLPGLGWRERLMLRRLMWGRAVGVIEDGKYYLDPQGYAAFRGRRRRRAALVLGVVLLLAGVMWWRAR